MAYCKHPLGPVPENTMRLCKKLLRGSAKRFVALAEELDELFVEFQVKLEEAYPTAGQWGIHPLRIVALLLLQAMEGLTDRQAAEAVSLNVGWKLVLRLPMEHEGWDSSVLTKARDRFLETEAFASLFDAILLKAKEKGYLSVVKQRTDSTQIEACVRSLNRTELVLETVRNAIEELTCENIDFVAAIRRQEWLQRYYLDRPFNYRLPKKESERTKIAETAGDDGFYILKRIAEAQASKRARLEKLDGIKTLARVLEEQFTHDKNGKPKFKDGSTLRPSGERLHSPYEPDARKSAKGETMWTGYKCHISETCVSGFPNLITDVQTRPGTENDSETLPSIIESLIGKALKPFSLLVDSGYVNVNTLAKVKKEQGIDVVARLTNGHSWQSKEGYGFDQSGFQINWKSQVAICPVECKSVQWRRTKEGGANIYFSPEQCSECPFKRNCTKGQFRVLHVKSKNVWDHMQWMRVRQQTAQFKREYAIRAGIEGTQSEFVKTAGRRSTVRGLAKTHQKILLAVIAVNLSRIFDWAAGKRHSKTRIGKFQRAFAVA